MRAKVFRFTPARRRFLQYLADNGPLTRFDKGYFPNMRVFLACRRAKLVCARCIGPKRYIRGRTSQTMELRISARGRRMLQREAAP